MKKHISTKFKNVVEEILALIKNTKLEITAIIISIVVVVLKLDNKLNLKDYFTSDRLNGIAAFFAITIGVYIAVVTILATSEPAISKNILKKKLDKKLINIIIVGIVENISAAGIAMFIPMNVITRYILFVFIIISILSFVKFIILLLLLFKGNLNQMAKDIDSRDRYENEIYNCLNKIANGVEKNLK